MASSLIFLQLWRIATDGRGKALGVAEALLSVLGFTAISSSQIRS